MNEQYKPQQIEARWEEKKAASAAEKSATHGVGKAKPNEQPKKSGGKARSYTVQRGDTLASISRKFYKSSVRWQRILDANSETLSKPSDLKPGQTLVIP